MAAHKKSARSRWRLPRDDDIREAEHGTEQRSQGDADRIPHGHERRREFATDHCIAERGQGSGQQSRCKTGGTQSGAGSTVIASGATLTIGGGVGLQRQVTVNSGGTTNWTAGRIDMTASGAFTNCEFRRNRVSASQSALGGGGFGGGLLINCLIADNQANSAGAAAASNSGGLESSALLINCTVVNNSMATPQSPAIGGVRGSARF